MGAHVVLLVAHWKLKGESITVEQPRQCRALHYGGATRFTGALDQNCPFGLGYDLVIECLLGICKGMGCVSSHGRKTKNAVSHLLHFISGFRNPFSWGWRATQTRVCILTTNIISRQVLLPGIPVVGRQTQGIPGQAG